MSESKITIPRLFALVMLLLTAVSVLSACGLGSSPEGVVRAYIDALNSRDKAKFIGLYSPDKRDNAAREYDWRVQYQYQITQVKTIVTRDTTVIPKRKVVTVQAILKSNTYNGDLDFHFYVEQLDGQWYIYAVGP